MSEKIFEVEHSAGEELVVRIRPPKLSMLSDETREHILSARREMLLALRSVLDAAIEYTESQEKAKGKGRKKIEVQ
ncbi:MAG: hypothetical protein HY673_11160 [Chloroflexi bacterium]|nr:hypothetical protein [Chloroflexota bacterium]